MGDLPEILKGGIAVDDRGPLSYLNTAPLGNVVRMYMVENFSTDTVRAFHGHRIEEKFLLVVSGSAIVVVAEMELEPLLEAIGHPQKYVLAKVEPWRYVLSARNPQLLHIPAGYANGFRALEPGTKLLFFSTTTIEQAKTDDYRFQLNYFGDEIWKAEDR